MYYFVASESPEAVALIRTLSLPKMDALNIALADKEVVAVVDVS